MPDEPREKTLAEVREEFLAHVRRMAKYWASQPNSTAQERCDGLAFSILTAIDGCSAGLPAFSLVPHPHPSDKEYHQSQGENWYPSEGGIEENFQLHALYYQRD